MRAVAARASGGARSRARVWRQPELAAPPATAQARDGPTATAGMRGDSASSTLPSRGVSNAARRDGSRRERRERRGASDGRTHLPWRLPMVVQLYAVVAAAKGCYYDG